MSASSGNKLIPVLAGVALILVIYVIWQQFSEPSRSTAGNPMTAIPTPENEVNKTLPSVVGADNDNPTETLRTVATSNEKLRTDVAQVIAMNNKLIEENKRLGGLNASVANNAEQQQSTLGQRNNPIDPADREDEDSDLVGKVIARGSNAVDSFSKVYELNRPRTETEKANAATIPTPGATVPVTSSTSTGIPQQSPDYESAVGGYKTLPPMGYSMVTEPSRNQGNGASNAQITRYVRTSGNDAYAGSVGGTSAAAAAQPVLAEKPKTIPYFTVPENSTLVGVRSMTSLIGRVPIDGRVTDPMQFKAIVGRDNLAANGFELPPDLEGMIITGIAIGDMALSCSEGSVRSGTFVVNDGTVRTISARNRSSGGGGNANSGSVGNDLGFISDEYGNPCIPGKFVTNAPSYLADLSMLKGLDVAAQAYSDAQRTVSQNFATQSQTSTITGSTGGFAMAQAASGATDEIVKWMVSRLKNSFDAVITPAGKSIVFHLDRELQIDKAPDARKIVYRQQGVRQMTRGEHYGLE